MKYSYDRTAAKGLTKNDFLALKQAVLGGEDDRTVLRLARRVRQGFNTSRIPDNLKGIQWFLRPPSQGFHGTINPREQFAEQIDLALKEWGQAEGRLQDARATVPKTLKLLEQLKSTMDLMKELRADNGADYYHHELDRVEKPLDSLVGLLDRFLELNR
jgi:hypothetical protein